MIKVNIILWTTTTLHPYSNYTHIMLARFQTDGCPVRRDLSSTVEMYRWHKNSAVLTVRPIGVVLCSRFDKAIRRKEATQGRICCVTLHVDKVLRGGAPGVTLPLRARGSDVLEAMSDKMTINISNEE